MEAAQKAGKDLASYKFFHVLKAEDVAFASPFYMNFYTSSNISD
jgi:hypothetical protein